MCGGVCCGIGHAHTHALTRHATHTHSPTHKQPSVAVAIEVAEKARASYECESRDGAEWPTAVGLGAAGPTRGRR